MSAVTAELIDATLRAAITPLESLQVINESEQHHGHAGYTDGNTHFRVRIVSLHMADLNRRLETEHRIKVALTAGGQKLVAERSFVPLQGARGVRKTIQEMVENLVAEKLLSGAYAPGETVRLTVKDDALVVKP